MLFRSHADDDVAVSSLWCAMLNIEHCTSDGIGRRRARTILNLYQPTEVRALRCHVHVIAVGQPIASCALRIEPAEELCGRYVSPSSES